MLVWLYHFNDIIMESGTVNLLSTLLSSSSPYHFVIIIQEIKDELFSVKRNKKKGRIIFWLRYEEKIIINN